LFQSVLRSFSLQFGFVIFCHKISIAKIAHKMLLKLTTGSKSYSRVAEELHQGMVLSRRLVP
jgi:hypothetical protein